ncbi:MAG: hypothetical protein KFKLKKLM_02349 [Flavobacteriales bacterium]|nr:hypothetical protein [Flavobacteriales bacterium]
MKKIISIISLLVLPFLMMAQETIFEEARTVYKRDKVFGGYVHTSGWGLNYRSSIYTSGFSKRSYEIEFTTIKHPKEIKTFSSILDNSNGYFYGKMNYLLAPRFSVGTHRTFISKQSVKGVEIAYVLHFGITTAYAKPIYLEVIIIDEENFPKTEFQRYDPDKHDRGDIVGKASFFYGFLKGRFYPGAHIKTALNFESSRQANRINAVEVGATLDAFLQNVPIMAETPNQQFFLNFYVGINFGSKKTE